MVPKVVPNRLEPPGTTGTTAPVLGDPYPQLDTGSWSLRCLGGQVARRR